MKSNNGFIKKIVNILLDVLVFLFSIILLITLYGGIQKKILGNDYSNFFGYTIFEVQTGSMEPEISVGDWIIVKSENTYELNDVVTYKLNDDYITHRVIEMYKDNYVTMGDANNTKDSAINKEQIVGKVVNVLGRVGLIKKILFNPAVLIALIITILLFDYTFKNKNNNIKMKDTKLYKFFSNIFNKKKTTQLKVEEHIINESKDESDNENKDIVSEIKIDVEPSSLETIESTNNISVDNTDNEFEGLTSEEIEDELGKTIMFRTIPVDTSEINNTLLEIADNEIKKEVKIEALQEIKETLVAIKEEPENNLTEINLELLEEKRNRRKSKNIIDKIMYIKSEELNEIIQILNENDKYKTNELTIKGLLIEAYITAKYYNDYTDTDIEYNNRNRLIKIERFITDVSKKIIMSYKGTDKEYGEKVKKYADMLKLIASLENGMSLITDMKSRNEFYKEEIVKYLDSEEEKSKVDEMVKAISKIQRNYVGIVEYLLTKLKSDDFELEITQLKSHKEIYAIKMNHNIKFSNIYSDYIIDKTYSVGIIAEDKMTILLNLLLLELVEDMISAEFEKKYVVYIPSSLYKKQSKFQSLLNMIEDDYAKENIFILASLSDIKSNKKFVKNIKKLGYKFALAIKEVTDFDIENNEYLYIADYIFVNKKDTDITTKITSIDDEVSKRVIYENIADKVGDFEVNI